MKEKCPGCELILPKSDGPLHRYVGASAACWARFAALSNGGSPPLAPGAMNILLTDAYMVQHPGVPSPQSIQSVAVHLLTLYGVLEKGLPAKSALWIRLRAVRDGSVPKHNRFIWLTPPSFANSLTIHDIIQALTPTERTAVTDQYVRQIWSTWSADYTNTVANWYAQFVLPDRL